MEYSEQILSGAFQVTANYTEQRVMKIIANKIDPYPPHWSK